MDSGGVCNCQSFLFFFCVFDIQNSSKATLHRVAKKGVQTVTSRVLEILNPGVLGQSKQISGPKWQFPNGTVIERFVNGRVNSKRWQKYGAVYRIWSGPHPEMYDASPLSPLLALSNELSTLPTVSLPRQKLSSTSAQTPMIIPRLPT